MIEESNFNAEEMIKALEIAVKREEDELRQFKCQAITRMIRGEISPDSEERAKILEQVRIRLSRILESKKEIDKLKQHGTSFKLKGKDEEER